MGGIQRYFSLDEIYSNRLREIDVIYNHCCVCTKRFFYLRRVRFALQTCSHECAVKNIKMDQKVKRSKGLYSYGGSDKAHFLWVWKHCKFEKDCPWRGLDDR
jgi:hypothetical protein